jgi:hypothetical protein
LWVREIVCLFAIVRENRNESFSRVCKNKKFTLKLNEWEKENEG